jgi:hypothetical protein
MTTITNKFYHDDNNGWLAVKFKLLQELGIADKISKGSYIKGQTVYLDEDVDMPIYIDAQKDRGITVNAVSIGHGKRSIVRNYTIYHVSDNASASAANMTMMVNDDEDSQDEPMPTLDAVAPVAQTNEPTEPIPAQAA